MRNSAFYAGLFSLHASAVLVHLAFVVSFIPQKTEYAFHGTLLNIAFLVMNSLLAGRAGNKWFADAMLEARQRDGAVAYRVQALLAERNRLKEQVAHLKAQLAQADDVLSDMRGNET